MSEEQIVLQQETGQTMAEYAVVLSVITLAIVSTLSLLSASMNAAFDRTVDIFRLIG